MPNILKDLEIDEVSFCGAGINQHSKVTLFKAATKTEDGKAFSASDYAYVPDKEKPSEWKLRLTSTPGGDPDARIVGAAVAALGPGFRGQKVQIPADDRAAVISRVRSAWRAANPDKDVKDLPDVLKSGDSQEGDNMPDDKLQKQLDDATATIKKLKADNARFEAIAKMTDAEKAYMSKLDDAAKDEFLKMESAPRSEIVKAATASDETIEVNGTTIRKSVVGDDMFAVIKSQQTQLKANAAALAKSQEAARIATFAKRASAEFAHIPGTDVEKAAVLEHIEKADDEVKKCFDQILKAAESAIAAAFDSRGHNNGQPAADSNAGKLATLAKAHSEKHNVSMLEAEVAVLETHPELYEG